MYGGGLFGDLPSAKKKDTSKIATATATATATVTDEKNGQGKKNKLGLLGAGNNEFNQPTPSTITASLTSLSSSSLKSAVTGSKNDKTTTGNNWFVHPTTAQTKTKTVQTTSNNKSQFLQLVGKAGTSMSFVPTAALKRKKKRPATATATATNNNNSNNTYDSSNKKQIRSESADGQQATVKSTVVVGIGVVEETTITTSTIKKSNNPQSTQPIVVVDIHGNNNNNGDGDGLTNNSRIVPSVGKDNYHDYYNTNENHHNNDTTTSTTTQIIIDPYDPFVPNDLLEYWEKKAITKQREKLERDTKEALERQKSIRRKIDEERLELQKSGNYNALLERERKQIQEQEQQHQQQQLRSNDSMMTTGRNNTSNDVLPSGLGLGRGRGRGRGLSNLPAWLIEKQRMEQQQAGLNNNNNGDSNGGW